MVFFNPDESIKNIRKNNIRVFRLKLHVNIILIFDKLYYCVTC